MVNAAYGAQNRIFSTLFKNSTIMTSTLLFLGNLGATEFMLIFLVVLLLFGGQKIPELMRGLGKGIREFNSAKNSVEDEIRQGMREAEKKTIEK
jgi:sec-independent protein translocase protein TatA